MTDYTHRINLLRNVKGIGWTFESYPVTKSTSHLRSLIKQRDSGFVRNIELIKLK